MSLQVQLHAKNHHASMWMFPSCYLVATRSDWDASWNGWVITVIGPQGMNKEVYRTLAVERLRIQGFKV